jgi:Aspartyl protease
MDFSRRSILSVGIGLPLATFSAARAMAQEDDVKVAKILLKDNRIWTMFQVGDNAPELFIVDTGAFHNAVAWDYSTQLKLRTDYTFEAQGLGGIDKHYSVVAKNVTIGGTLKFPDLHFGATKSLNGSRYKGVLGSYVLTAANTDLDFAKGELRVFPKGRKIGDGFAKVPGGYHQGKFNVDLRVPCTVDGLAGNFQIDSGSPLTLLLDGKASAATGLWGSKQPYVPWRQRGFGNARTLTRLFRMKRLEMHGLVFNDPLVMLSDPRTSKTQLVDVDGLVGLRALRHFHLSIDLTDKSLWLAQNEMSFADEVRYPMSGLWFEQQGDRIMIVDVGVGSPAANAGLMVGDEIVGKAWDALRIEVNGAAGAEVTLEYERLGKRAASTLTLTPYI